MAPAQRDAFIRALAEYLVNDQARKSIELEMGKPCAVEWAKVRNLSPVRGWATVDEAVASLHAALVAKG